MNAAVVDTDVVSMLFRGDTRAAAYRPHITGRLLGISFRAVAELERWLLERDWDQKRNLDLGAKRSRKLDGMSPGKSPLRMSHARATSSGSCRALPRLSLRLPRPPAGCLANGIPC